ncbi:NAD(P)/FAD-dependent oxidoreductase [Celerinatantimonas yamalensis]|uniref:FAD-dependent oxidoreductase n=1 Tax=Celerinatantimonas yamalensis TaxID=559956 RepID=A0ABW9G4J7_9GAMM
MKIAIVGSGISGMTCAHLLSKHHDIVLLEKNSALGGHTATKDIEIETQRYQIDTGFIVFNDRTYPLFSKLLARLQVNRQPTEMSFSVINPEMDLQYNGHTLNTLFGQRRNLLRPWFYHFVAEILRFNRLAKQSIDLQADLKVGQFLDKNRFSLLFCQNYLLPMGAAIWSVSLKDIRQFSMRFFTRFFAHHGLLDVTNRPQWYVVPGGSRQYIKPLLASCQNNIRLNSEVSVIERSDSDVKIRCTDGWHWQGDQVIFACHSDQALAILGDTASHAEREILGAMHYQSNQVWLHQDKTILPTHPRLYASWNYRLAPQSERETLPATVSYYMNRLQGLTCPQPFIVTLNPTQHINSSNTFGQYEYAHPQFDQHTPHNQGRRAEINGHQCSWFCGAYWYNGFHEDGVRSANDVASALGGETL